MVSGCQRLENIFLLPHFLAVSGLIGRSSENDLFLLPMILKLKRPEIKHLTATIEHRTQ